MSAPVMPMTRLAYLSANTRRERVRVRIGVGQGVSLALLLHEEHPALQGVRLAKLVRWLPGVSNTQHSPRASRILLGLPEQATVAELDAYQLGLLVGRVRSREQLIATRIVKEHQKHG